MLLAGDELGRTQDGNNNAYCQDNELSWLDWDLDERARGILDVHPPSSPRSAREHPVFRRSEFSTGEERQGSGAPDVWWFRPDGRRMTQADWARGDAFALGAFLNGAEIPSRTRRRRADRRRVVHRPLQRLAGARLVRPPARALRPAVDARALHGGARRAAER